MNSPQCRNSLVPEPPLCCAVPKELAVPHTRANRKARVWNQTGSRCRRTTTRCTSPGPKNPLSKASFPCPTGHCPCPCNCANTGANPAVPEEQHILQSKIRSTKSIDIKHALWHCVQISLADINLCPITKDTTKHRRVLFYCVSFYLQ
jgi:hypothetical protein